MSFLSSRFAGLRDFMIVWSAQTISRFGTYMTFFALVDFWLWEETGSAAALAAVLSLSTAGAIVASLFGGVLIDRFSRKTVMIAADAIGALSTVVYLILFVNDSLAVWHLYAGSAFLGDFNQLHDLAYSAATTMMVTKTQYARAGSLRFLTHYGAAIFAPPLAAVLYSGAGLTIVMIVDILTVLVAIGTVAAVTIPAPTQSQAGRESRKSRLVEVMYGFKYIRSNPSMLAIVAAMASFMFFHDMSLTVHTPMILARTNTNINTLAVVSTAAGLGGLTGSIIMTTWGGPTHKMAGWLVGTMSAGLAKMTFSLGRVVGVWLPVQFWSSVNFPIRGGSIQAILMAKVEPDVQGRFFASMDVAIMLLSIAGRLIAGVVGDQIAEPAMASTTVLSPIFGTGPGAGFAVIYFLSAFAMFAVGAIGFFVTNLYHVEKLVPDFAAPGAD